MHTEPSHLTRLATQPSRRKEKPTKNLKQRAYLNSVTSILDYGAKQIAGFIVNPFLVTGLGTTLYGVWQILGQMTGFANLADTRATNVLKWTIAKNRDIATDEELRGYVTSALLVTAVILPLLLVFGSIISWYAPYITGVSDEYFNIVRLTTAILILSLIVHKVFNIFESVLRGMNLGYKRMGLRAIIVFFGAGLKITILILGYGLVELAVVQVIIAIVTGLTLFYVVKKHVAWFGFGKTNVSNIFNFGKLSGWYMGRTFAKMLLLNSDKIILGIISGPALVTTYTLTRFSSMTIQGIVANTIHGMKPGLGGIVGKRDYTKVIDVRRQMMTFTWLISTVFGVTILLFNESFLGLWVGSEYFAGKNVNLLIVLIAIQYIYFQNDGGIISLTLNIKRQVYLSVIAAALTLFLSYMLIDQYGIIGLCISILIGRLVLTIGLPIVVQKYFETETLFDVGNLIRPLLVSILLLGSSYLIADSININNWIYLISGMILMITVTLILCWILGMNSAQRKSMRDIFMNIKLFKTN